jgi:hypothetical protein
MRSIGLDFHHRSRTDAEIRVMRMLMSHRAVGTVHSEKQHHCNGSNNGKEACLRADVEQSPQGFNDKPSTVRVMFGSI